MELIEKNVFLIFYTNFVAPKSGPNMKNSLIRAGQLLLYKFCYMRCNVLFSHIKNCVLKIILDALFEFKSKDKYERKMLNRLKNLERNNDTNSFCLMSPVLFFFGTSKWTNGKRMKQNKGCLKMWCYRISPIQWYEMWKQYLFHCHLNEKRGWINCQKYIIDLASCSTCRHTTCMCEWYLLFVNNICKLNIYFSMK